MNKSSCIKNIAVITPGGDSSGMNACIRAVVRQSIYYGFRVFGVYRGYEGLIEGDIKELNKRSVSNIIQHGGTILKSSRCEKIKTSQGIKDAVRQLKSLEIDCLIVIGGEGSLGAGYKMSKYGISVIGIPASIDNDIYGTDETIGFDTAVDVAIDAIDKIRDTAVSFNRVFMIEVMGREHGFLALTVGLASGAEHIIIPEIPYDLDHICNDLKAAKERGKTSEIMIFAEGAGDVFKVAKMIERKTGISTRASVLGYIQRGGSPSARSRIMGMVFGARAVELVKKGIKNKLIVIRKDKVGTIDLKEAITKKKKLNMYFYDLANRLSG